MPRQYIHVVVVPASQPAPPPEEGDLLWENGDFIQLEDGSGNLSLN